MSKEQKALPTSVPSILSTERLKDRLVAEYTAHADAIEKFLNEEWPKVVEKCRAIEEVARLRPDLPLSEDIERIQGRYETIDRLRQRAAQLRREARRVQIDHKAPKRKRIQESLAKLAQLKLVHEQVMDEQRVVLQILQTMGLDG